MTANSSNVAGFLQPTSTPPVEDLALDTLLQTIIVGIVGLSGSLVRPRWQNPPPQQPAITVDWCAVGIIDEDSDDYPKIMHRPAGDGSDELLRNETISVLASFYGPNCRGNAKILRDGIYVAQNRDAIRAAGFEVTLATRLVGAPELVGQQWVRRSDLSFTLQRTVSRTFNVFNILSASGQLTPDSGDVENWSAPAAT